MRFSCAVQTMGTPPSEPYCWWVRCECGYRTALHGSVREALAELDRLHRQEVAA